MPALLKPRRFLQHISLERHSVGALAHGGPRCHHCHRTPLVGELIHLYGAGRFVCELCRARQREAPVRTEIMHSPEHQRAVKVRPRAA
jgi:hypothetical protein